MTVERSNISLQEAISHSLTVSDLSVSERRATADLAYGYFRSRIRLEYILRHLATKPDAFPKPFSIMLSLGLYSLLFQERTKDFVVINNIVEWGKRLYGKRLAGAANAILRGCQRRLSEFQDMEWYENGTRGGLQAKALFYAMPHPIARLWADSYGEEAAVALLQRSFQRPWVGIRVNSAHSNASQLRGFFAKLPASTVSVIDDYGFAIAPGALPDEILGRHLNEWAQCGALVRQAPGSVQILKELGLFDWKGPVWDCCAGIGGKSAALLDRGVNVCLCSDTSHKRLGAFSHLYKKSGNPQLMLADAKSPPLKIFDGHILADVPCSGLGVLARRPDIRKIENDFDRRLLEFQTKQLAILESLHNLLQPERQLAYITCTLNPNENERLVRAFLCKRKDMEIMYEWHTPHKHPWLEGMYGVVLKKSAGL